MTTKPTVSVILPVHNGGDLLAEQLEALSRQTYRGRWELVVADNGSTDGSLAVVKSWATRLPNLRIIDASARKGAAYARNAGAAQAAGDLLAFCDADDVVADHWLADLVAGLADADVVAGAIETTRLNTALMRQWRPFDVGAVPISHGWLPYGLSANIGFRAATFRALDGFREDYPVGEDVEISWRAQLRGHRFSYAGNAVVHYRFRSGLRPLLRQYVAYGTIGPRLFRDFAAAGMPMSGVRGAVGPWVRLLASLPFAVLSRAARGDILRRVAFRVGRIRGSVQMRVLYL